MFGFRIAALGPMIVGGREGMQLRDRTVLGVLLVRGPTKSSTDQIAFALWGDGRPASYRKVIQGSVVRLRQVLGADAIRTVDDGYRLDLAAEVVDVSCFERWIEAARQQLAAGHAERAAGEVRRALELWRGPPMPELEGWPPREVEGAPPRNSA